MAKRKKVIIWLIIVALIGGGFFSYLKSRKPKVSYTTADVQKTNLFQTVSTTGTLNMENQIDLSFKGSGRLEEINVSLGDEVKKGQRLARIDPGTLYSELRQAEEDVRVQKRTLADMKRRKSTYDKEQEDAQRAIIKKYEAAITAKRSQIREIVIYSPIEGKIIRKNYEEGENVAANSTIITVARGELEIEANIPESDIVKIQIGQKADVTFDALTSEEKFEAEVFEIEPASTVIQDVVYYKVKFKLANPDLQLKIGMSNDIDIRTAEKDNVLVIPLRAIKTEGDRKYVEILKDEKNNIIDKVFVTTGLSGDDGMVEITSGLKGGEKVVTLTK